MNPSGGGESLGENGPVVLGLSKKNRLALLGLRAREGLNLLRRGFLFLAGYCNLPATWKSAPALLRWVYLYSMKPLSYTQETLNVQF